MKRIVGLLAPIFLLLLLMIAGALAAQPIAAAAEKADECGASNGNTVAAQFQIPAASRIFHYFPSMGKTPELSADDQPAYVVVFGGPYRNPRPIVDPNAPSAAPFLQDVICVIQADGTVNVYSDVSRAGFKAP